MTSDPFDELIGEPEGWGGSNRGVILSNTVVEMEQPYVLSRKRHCQYPGCGDLLWVSIQDWKRVEAEGYDPTPVCSWHFPQLMAELVSHILSSPDQPLADLRSAVEQSINEGDDQ